MAPLLHPPHTAITDRRPWARTDDDEGERTHSLRNRGAIPCSNEDPCEAKVKRQHRIRGRDRHPFPAACTRVHTLPLVLKGDHPRVASENPRLGQSTPFARLKSQQLAVNQCDFGIHSSRLAVRELQRGRRRGRGWEAGNPTWKRTTQLLNKFMSKGQMEVDDSP